MWHRRLRIGRLDHHQAISPIGLRKAESRIGVFSLGLGFALLLGAYSCFSPLLLSGEACAQSPNLPRTTEFDKEQKIPYEERLRFYIDLKTKDFLVDMAAKEMLLLQTIENLTAEIKQRGVEGLLNDDPGFDLLYKKMQTLSDSYTAELEAILAVLDEIAALSRMLEKERRYDLVEQFQDLKNRLVAVLEDRELYKKAPPTNTHVNRLIKEYDVEIDSLLRMYNRLEKFRKSAVARGDTAILPLVEKQKNKILAMVDGYHPALRDSLAPDVAQAFVHEIEKIAGLLTELDKLERTASHSLEAFVEIESQRRNIVLGLDERLLRLLGLQNYADLRRPTIEEVFNVWRGVRLADFQVRLAEYTVMKKRLLETGNSKARARMLERDLTAALLNYVAERYQIAELQFNTVLQDYGSYFDNWDAVIFYRSESLYARSIYPAAYESYEELLRHYPNSRFLGLALLRLLTISYALRWEQPFFTYYDRIDSSASVIDRRIVERAHCLAGYYHLMVDNYAEAETTLSKIPEGTKYYFMARYLTGIAQANRGNLAGAMTNFKYLAGTEGTAKIPLPGLDLADPKTTWIRNNAMMRLGFIYYQRGELENATRYFERVSRGAENYDQTLMALSWAYMKKGNLDRAIATTGTLLGNYLASNYQYEALVLSAHCQRLLDQPQTALQELRYVTNARGALELSTAYHDERQQILAQLSELNRMEKTALEHQDKQLYDLITEAQQTLVEMMVNFGYRSNTGNLLIEEFSEERQALYRQMQQLDRLVPEAQALGLPNVARDVIEHRNRLVRVLETYQADRAIRNVNYFIDYPLAAKESAAVYRKQIVANVLREMEAEQARLKQNLATTDKLITENSKAQTDLALDLQMVQEDFKNLKYRLDQFQTWLSNYDVDEVGTDSDQWADLSGFGISDITFQELNKRDQKIDLYSQNISSIDRSLRSRKSELEQMLKNFDKEMRKIEEELLNEQVRLDKLEHETYFRHSYFDTSASEVQITKPLDSNELPEE